jgi:methyl-accepting chemotaxis protein
MIGLLVMGFLGLYSMRHSLFQERRAQITQLLDFADSQLRYYHGLETSGKMTREEAQANAKAAIGAQKQGADNYFFIRNLNDDYFVLHPMASMMGKPVDGGKLPDGRTAVQAYRQGLAQSPDNKTFIELSTFKPGQNNEKRYPKLNGVLKFEPWGWMPGIGFYLDDIDAQFWRYSSFLLLVGTVVFVMLGSLVFRMRTVILRQLGGEPQDAAESMRRIASGDLHVDIALSKDDTTSLMASLKVMQMKLKNITASIQDNASTLTEQVQVFDEVAKSYAQTKSEEELAALSRSVKKLGRTADILGKSISRFKL